MLYQDIIVDGESVSFIFDKPKTHQPRLDPECKNLIESAQKNNSKIVECYNKLELDNNDPNQIQDDIAEEFTAYFNSYGPKLFEERLPCVKHCKMQATRFRRP